MTRAEKRERTDDDEVAVVGWVRQDRWLATSYIHTYLHVADVCR